MAKKINWLDQFAMDYQDTLEKTASLNREAEQVIVDCAAYPNAKVNSLVDYKGKKYKIISTQYQDKTGPGILLEKLAESNFGTDDPTSDAVISNGEVKATKIEDDANCCGDTFTKTAAANEEVELPELDESSEYPDIITKPGGVKPIPSAPIEQEKRVTDPPYHPTYDPGNQYALDIPDDFDDSAKQTANIIAQEDAQDRTTVEGYFSWNKNIILDKIVNDAKAEMPADDSDDELTSFDDSADAEVDLPDDNEDEDELASFDDSDSDNDEDLDDSEEDIPEDSDEVELAADLLTNNDDDDIELTEEDIPESDTESDDDEDTDLDEVDLPDEADDELERSDDDDDAEAKKAEASLNDTNRIISRLASLI